MSEWILALLQTALFVAAAPLFAGWIKRVKCRLQNRCPPAWFQPYRDLRRLLAKEIVLARTASPVFRLAPYVVCGTAILAASVVPFVFVHVPMAAMADAIVLVGLFALGRFFLALAGLDVGTAFGGMGSSREMTVAALAEPAMLMVIFTLAMVASSTNLATVVAHTLAEPPVLRPSLLFALLALVLVGIAETGRIPVDNPATHLELTMIHEAMILEYSGRHLALMELAAQVKLMIYAVLVVNLFFPWGIAATAAPAALAAALAAVVAKLALLGALLAAAETAVAKMRLFRVPTYLAVAYSLALVGMLSHVILETR
ncbi:respiratory chain complex I subunit 1 family protein [Inmirania thermothiophila]|uniref:Formate hydrogenlyase subunit 4 n=1 Tax=Inmirania thermothiophila TaxID=1750597 RepID=A0A3N1XSD3_9GAMM|nr:NADH-quinone oxidoreductase subunit H [Inmirania thermothiophila]ROR29554.1 formate hydrogenlyase subunit 4 [Inmirania thermothiophila]